MAFTDSHVFRAYLTDTVTKVTNMDIDTDSMLVALFGNTGTPDRNATSALSAYNAATSAWVTANEVFQAGQWAQGGIALASPVVNSGTANVVFYTGTNPASGSAATLSNVYGCLVYSNTTTTVSKQGVCFNWFGGPNSVTNGTFTVVWNANGIWRATV